MNIRDCSVKSTSDEGPIVCPGCHRRRCRRHGKYSRKGFHARNQAVVILPAIRRYLCLNPECPLCTFSILPPTVLRYCRFFWDDLLAVKRDLGAGKMVEHIAQMWHVGQAVILRAAGLLSRLVFWVEALHREVTDGKPVRDLGLMVKIVTAKLGRLELTRRWYRHRYPLRFSTKSVATQFIRLCQ